MIRTVVFRGQRCWILHHEKRREPLTNYHLVKPRFLTMSVSRNVRNVNCQLVTRTTVQLDVYYLYVNGYILVIYIHLHLCTIYYILYKYIYIYIPPRNTQETIGVHHLNHPKRTPSSVTFNHVAMSCIGGLETPNDP